MMFPRPPEGAKERTVELENAHAHSAPVEDAAWPAYRSAARQFFRRHTGYFSFLTIIAILCADGIIVSEASAARLLIFVYAGRQAPACPELVRDISCKMSEIELSCRVSGADLLAARMFIIGAANLIGLVLTAVIAAAKYSADLAVLLASGAALMFTSSLLTLLALRALPMIKKQSRGTVAVAYLGGSRRNGVRRHTVERRLLVHICRHKLWAACARGLARA